MLPGRLRVFYLHGFASGPGSRKAAFFAERLRAAGVAAEVPDLSEGNFEGLTITGQLKVIEQVAEAALRNGERVALIGSSLGGYLAALYASRHPEVERLILLAPAFQFYQLWLTELGREELESWRQNGSRNIFHYGKGCQALLGYQLMEDAARYESFPAFSQPALIFHGMHDPVVPVQYSEQFAQERPNVRLIRPASGHELTDVLDEIWPEAKNFLLKASAD